MIFIFLPKGDRTFFSSIEETNIFFFKYKATLLVFFATHATLFCRHFLHFIFKTKPIQIFRQYSDKNCLVK